MRLYLLCCGWVNPDVRSVGGEKDKSGKDLVLEWVKERVNDKDNYKPTNVNNWKEWWARLRPAAALNSRMFFPGV